MWELKIFQNLAWCKKINDGCLILHQSRVLFVFVIDNQKYFAKYFIFSLLKKTVRYFSLGQDCLTVFDETLITPVQKLIMTFILQP